MVRVEGPRSCLGTEHDFPLLGLFRVTVATALCALLDMGAVLRNADIDD
jgi:hypothetical protein